jgi:magnesium transporter
MRQQAMDIRNPEPERNGLSRRLFSNRVRRTGLPPGTLLDETPSIPARTRLIHYGSAGVVKEEEVRPDHFRNVIAKSDDGVTWLHVQGQPDKAFLAELGTQLDIHPLVLEDIQSRGERPKIDDYDDLLFVVLNVPRWQDGDVVLDQFSLLLGEGFIVSIHDSQVDISAVLFNRLERGRSGLRSHGSDYLLYALIDLVVDEAFPVLETFGNNVEQLEESLIVSPGMGTLPAIQAAKRTLIHMRRQLWPTREVISNLSRSERDSSLINDELRPYLRDLYDHTVQLMELVDTYRDVISGLTDIYLSSVSNRLSDIMRTLTVISTVFIPLTFITGLYGMNFASFTNHWWVQPLLHWEYGYPFVWLLMLAVAAGMLAFFKRRGWILQR